MLGMPKTGHFLRVCFQNLFKKKKKKKIFHFFFTPKKKKKKKNFTKNLAHPIKWTVKNRVFFASIFRKNRVFRENRENRSFFKNAQKPRF